MKHSWKITLLLLAMFFITQMFGIFVVGKYAIGANQLPYGMEPPPDVEQKSAWDLVFSFAVAFSIVVIIMLLLTKYKAETFLRFWFFFVVILAMGITINSLLLKIPYASLTSLVVAIPLAFYKIFRRNLVVHNITELLIYPGIGAIFVVMLMSWTNSTLLAIVVILILISLYDMHAVWHSGFMQKMAQYQIQKVKVFTGFFVPYIGRKQKQLLAKVEKYSSKKQKERKIKVGVAILGGGDVVFPIILAGVVLVTLGLIPALLVSIGATLALLTLFLLSEKGKFYPAMPFITIGCFVALGIARLVF